VPRSYIGISPTGPTALYNVRRGPTGEPQLLLDQDAITTMRLNFADWLEGAETILAVTVTANACTATHTLTSPNLDITVSNATSINDGKITVVATSSTGDAYRGIIRVRRTNRFGDERQFMDYV
jgi:hypothetical protein